MYGNAKESNFELFKSDLLYQNPVVTTFLNEAFTAFFFIFLFPCTIPRQ